MLKLIILEGPRGTGKSTITRKLRDKIEGSTLINPTGFALDGVEGHDKIVDYYSQLDTYLWTLAMSKQEYVVILDRTFFSEAVYSKIYKSYDFSDFYNHVLDSMLSYVTELHLFYLRLSDEDKLRERLNRDKVQLFDKVEESVAQSLKQQEYYDALFKELNLSLDVNFDTSDKHYFSVINTDELSIDEVYNSIMEAVSCPIIAEEK